MVLWSSQSSFWHEAEQYEMERHEEQRLGAALLQTAQVEVAIWRGRSCQVTGEDGHRSGSDEETEGLSEVVLT